MLRFLSLLSLLPLAALAADPGRDLLAVFARAHRGQPLRAVAIGGSITQAGKGWIGDWLAAQFPQAAVTMHNAGMSATGSSLGVFRLERDVIALQPDLVLVEFAVNDGGLADADAIRYNESIVVRLKQLPQPPAIVFLEVAAQGGANRARHSRVAAHYGLLDVDLQVPLDRHLAEAKLEWQALMSDNVHPNDQGHAFYTKVIAECLAPFVARARQGVEPAPPAPLPPPLSAKPLLLDGRLVPLAAGPGWRGEDSLPFWWSRFFNGVIGSAQPGATLTLSARGTTLGLFYALDNSYGSFLASLDGGVPEFVDCGVRKGYSYSIFGRDLAPGQHLLRLAVAKPIGKAPAPVKLGYLLVAGGTAASGDLVPQGDFDLAPRALASFAPVPAAAWRWSGPYGGAEATVGPTADLETVFPPEDAAKSAQVAWQSLPGSDPLVDFAALTGRRDRGVCYAAATLPAERARSALLALRLDYFGKLWVNGRLVRSIADGHGHPHTPLLIPVELRQGNNEILLKVHSGSNGNQFALFVEQQP